MTPEDAHHDTPALEPPSTPPAFELLADRVVLLILRALGTSRVRTRDLEQQLATEAARGTIHRRLRRLGAAGVLRRHSFAEVPPRVEHEITSRGRRLLVVAFAGMRWAELEQGATASTPGEVARALRAAAAVARPRSTLHGRCMCEIGAPGTQSDIQVALTLANGGVSAGESLDGGAPNARLYASTADWWDALITGDAAKIAVVGDARLASGVLAALHRGLIA